MRLLITRPSPYARKAHAAIFELDLVDRIEVIELAARMPEVAKPDLDPVNPLGKVPTLLMEDGEAIVDSPVIVAYLDALAGPKLVPQGPERWPALTLEALADGAMDAGVVLRWEQLAPPERRRPELAQAHADKIARLADTLEAQPHRLASPFTVGQLALACAIEWLHFRQLIPDLLGPRPNLAAWHASVRERPSLAHTRPQ